MERNISGYHCAICLLRRCPEDKMSMKIISSIISRGRPTPALPCLAKECRYKGKVFTRRFKKDNYSRYDWLTGCEIQNKLFCWPCYIFTTDPTDTWGYKGFDGLSNFSNSVKTHINQEGHIFNTGKYNCYVTNGSRILSEDAPVQRSVPSRPKERLVPKNIAVMEEQLNGNDEEQISMEDISNSGVEVESLEDQNMQCTENTDCNAREAVNIHQSATPGAEKYQLKWHSHQQNLNSSISCLYKNERYADVMLITCNNEENFSIPAHKLVLGTSSTYFANIFEKNIAPPNAMTYIVLPPELTKRAIQTLIQYMYTGESTVSVDILNEVLRGGEVLKIRGLWRNQSSPDTVASSDHSAQKETHSRHRTERVSVDRIPLQEPRIAQHPTTPHDSPVIVTNLNKNYVVGGHITAQMPASSSTPIINVKKDVAIDPGERSRSDHLYEAFPTSSASRSQSAVLQESVNQISQPYSTPKTSPPVSVFSNAESISTSTTTGAQEMPVELNFLNVKEEPVEWTDVNPEEMSDADRERVSMVKVELHDHSSNANAGIENTEEQVYSPLTCELCSETFTVPAEWVRHIESHTDPPYTLSKRRRRNDDGEADITAALKCDLCAMFFVTPAEWVRHVQSTHTETELAMSNSKAFPRRSSKSSTSDLQQYPVASSTAQQQEKICTVCNKSFPSYASMIIHKRTHTGERPFYCDICNKGFNVKSNLLRHMRTLHGRQESLSPTQQGDGDSQGGAD
ncbi:myoneurin isoform X3 [Toxorhynchites rutilus septentrionalis]|nr:myoneurin isoform X3 [Toxorhynchites rutilus septentrionalis]